MQLTDESLLPGIQAATGSQRIAQQDLGIPLRTLPAWLDDASNQFNGPTLTSTEMDFGLSIEADCGGKVIAPDSRLVLHGQRAMIDTFCEAGLLQRSVLMLCPKRPPVMQHRVAIPFAGLDATQPGSRRLPKGQENVRMVIVRIIPLFEDGRVDGDIGNHAAADEGFSHEV
jgi:hypothetical protein